MIEEGKLTKLQAKQMQGLLAKAREEKLTTAELQSLANLIKKSGGVPEKEINEILQRHGFANLEELTKQASAEAVEAINALIGLGIAALIGYFVLKALE